MITTVWRQFFVVWSERNATVHGNTQATRQEALRRKMTREINQWFYHKDQLLQSDRIDILEAKFGPTIDTADTQIAKDLPHVSLNWLRMYNPILHDGIKLATATALQGVRQMSTYFPKSARLVINNRLNPAIPASTIPGSTATTGFDAKRNLPHAARSPFYPFCHNQIYPSTDIHRALARSG
jgi:hypothetical protein